MSWNLETDEQHINSEKSCQGNFAGPLTSPIFTFDTYYLVCLPVIPKILPHDICTHMHYTSLCTNEPSLYTSIFRVPLYRFAHILSLLTKGTVTDILPYYDSLVCVAIHCNFCLQNKSLAKSSAPPFSILPNSSGT